MKASHFYKVSYSILYVLLGCIVVVSAMFFSMGYDNPTSDSYNQPMKTDILLYLIYGMLGLSLLTALSAIVFQFIHSWRQSRKRTYRLFIGICLFVALLLTCLLCASSKPLTVNGSLYAYAVWLKVTDMLLYAIYILLGLAVLCILLAIAGVFRHIHFKR